MEASSSEVRLGPGVGVDYRDALDLAYRVDEDRIDDPTATVDRLPFHLLMSDVLPDWYEDWVELEREHFRQLRLHALEELCRRFTGAGMYGRAVEAGMAAVQAEPLRESAHRTLMRAYAAEGNPGEVVRQYRWYRRVVREELGGAPSAEMEELVRGLGAAR